MKLLQVPELDHTIVVSKTITTETAHRLTNYAGKCAHIHGHSWQWTVKVRCGLMSNGLAIDFGDIKQVLNSRIHDLFDHAIVLHELDPLVGYASDLGMEIGAMLAPIPGGETRVVVVDANPTSENMALYAKKVLWEDLRTRNPSVASVKVIVNETCTSAAEV